MQIQNNVASEPVNGTAQGNMQDRVFAAPTATSNPYQPPASPVERDSPARPLVAASRWRRFGTLVVDYACFMLFAFGVGVVGMLLFGEAASRALKSIPDTLLGCLLMLVYYCFFEGIWARTPGKLLFGTRVVDEEGGKPSFAQVVGRTLCRFIPFEPFSCFREQGWHDSLPHTRVVMAR